MTVQTSEMTAAPELSDATEPLVPEAAKPQKKVRQSILREVLGMVAARPGVLSFAVGLPSEEVFPAEELGETAARLCHEDRTALQYGVPYPPLKAQIVDLMARRGVRCREEQIFLTSGAQQGMDLITRLLLEPRGTVAFEDIVYDGIQMAVRTLEPKVLSVPNDPYNGIDLDAVESIFASGQNPAFLYTIPEGHNPLGISLSEEKRQRLAGLARQYRIPVVEDDAYGFLYYNDKSIPPLRSFEDEWVYYVGSFSKILAPALRVGWAVVPEEMVPSLAALKQGADIDGPTFGQRVVSAYLATGQLPAHLEKVRAAYRSRKEAMLGALDRYFPKEVSWNRPSSGMFVWVDLPRGYDAANLVRSAIEQDGVAFTPGAAFVAEGGERLAHCMRLAFSYLTPEQIEEGVERLSHAVKRFLS